MLNRGRWFLDLPEKNASLLIKGCLKDKCLGSELQMEGKLREGNWTGGERNKWIEIVQWIEEKQ